jgi:hypothetical protein
MAKKHGGARAGSGRKALDPDGQYFLHVRVTGAQKLAFQRQGGAKWLRSLLEAVKPQT